MARGTQHRKRRPPANAPVVAQPAARPKRPSRPKYEDQLFFGRLRAHAKWMFVFLAAVFAISFVIFGVGSGSTGISDVLQNMFSGSSASSKSLSKLQKATVDHPKLASAWRNYATALEQKKQDDNAIAALTQYTILKPKDEGALLELAGLDLRRASDWNTVYSLVQERIQALTPSPVLSPKSTSPLGQAVASVTTPIASAVSAERSNVASTAYSKVYGYLNSRLDAYKKLAKLKPNDAITQFSLGQAAQDAGDIKTAIAAYKAFLKLAPDDSEAPAARKILKQLEAQLKATTGTGTIGKKPTKTATGKTTTTTTTTTKK